MGVYHSWNIAENFEINLDVVNKATRVSLARLDESFFRVRFDDTECCTYKK